MDILKKLIEDILNENADDIRKVMDNIGAKDFKKTFSHYDGSTLLHFVFSCGNSEIVKLFIIRLGTLIQKKELKPEALKSLLETRGDGGSIAIDGILAKGAASKILMLFKAIHDVEILEKVLRSEGLDGNIYFAINEDKESDIHEKKEAIYNAMSLHSWSSCLQNFLFSPAILLKKRQLSEKYFDKVREDNDEEMASQKIIETIFIDILISVANANKVTYRDSVSLSAREPEGELPAQDQEQVIPGSQRLGLKESSICDDVSDASNTNAYVFLCGENSLEAHSFNIFIN